MSLFNKFLHNPWYQLFVIIIFVFSYWVWELNYNDHYEYYAFEYNVEKMEADTLNERMRERQLEMEEYFPGQTHSYIEKGTEINIESKLEFWDMVLGHISSIMGSLAVMLTPLITYFANKRKTKNNSDQK